MQDKRKTVKFWIGKIIQHFRDQNFQIDPLPQIILNIEPIEEDNLFISTGNYSHIDRRITLYLDNRHIKDILRTFCHEMIHHHQNLDNPDYFMRVYKGGSIESNSELKEIESEAFLFGNLYFRSFTEKFSHT